ncbi:unnamed protein product [Toxocara canis]|nr:unnamed protein product [Toxocara canis]
MNQTYTIGTRHRKKERHASEQRSTSADSDVVDLSINGAIAGFFPRTCSGKIDIANASLFRCKRGSARSTGALNQRWSSKLPSVNDCDSERKCCQRPWTRTQIELQKYKEALKSG